jgi:hypothetical protein
MNSIATPTRMIHEICNVASLVGCIARSLKCSPPTGKSFRDHLPYPRGNLQAARSEFGAAP